jgi:hypothetical protein
MKAELKENLDKVIEMFLLQTLDIRGEKEYSLSQEEVDRRFNMFEKLMDSGDSEVLRGLIGMLAEKEGEGFAFDESFSQQIFNYYTHEQIMDAVFEKFDAIYDNEVGENKLVVEGVLEEICSSLWSPYWKGREDGRGFRRFREMFNKIRPRHAERFLNGMEAYKDEDEKAMIATLREDMKKWGDKSATEE